MPRAIVAPTSTLILSDEEAARRLGGISPASLVHDDVEEASQTLADDLGYQVAYGTWEDDLSPAVGNSLALPHLGAFEIVSIRSSAGGETLASTSYSLQSSAGLIESLDSWRDWWLGHRSILVNGGVPDFWTVRYRGGWWLETMTGQRPADVPELPHSLRRAFVELLKDMYFGSKISPHWRSTSNEGASVTFNAPGGSEALTRYHDLIRPYKLVC